MKQSCVILVLLIFFSFKNEVKFKDTIQNESTEEIVSLIKPETLDLEVYDYKGLKPLLYKDNDKVNVVNFWATWCAPCVKELPYFEALHAKYSNNEIEILLVSLDFPRQYETRLKPFIEKEKLKSKVVALDDVDMNTWISEIDANWDGAIPATIIYKGNKRQFYAKSFTQAELEIEIEKFIKH